MNLNEVHGNWQTATVLWNSLNQTFFSSLPTILTKPVKAAPKHQYTVKSNKLKHAEIIDINIIDNIIID